MIFVERGSVRIPSSFSRKDGKLQAAKLEAAAHFALPYEERRQIKFKFSENALSGRDVRDALSSLFNGKCAYCESIIGAVAPLEIDRLRPRTFATTLAGESEHDHYWWLYYEWENLYASCPFCNRNKGKRYPVEGPRAEIGAVGEDLRNEKAQLLDPCADDPDQHLLFDDQGIVAGITERGRITIDVFGLNRNDLVEARKREIQTLLLLLGRSTEANDFQVKLQDEVTNPERPYLAAKRQILARALKSRVDVKTSKMPVDRLTSALSEWLGDAIGSGVSSAVSQIIDSLPSIAPIQDHVSKLISDYLLIDRGESKFTTESLDIDAAYFRKTRLVERVEIKNFRQLGELTLDFSGSMTKSAPWAMLLGENGTGKSSVLQAICLALIGQRYATELNLKPLDFIKREADFASVRVYLSNLQEPVDLKITTEQGFVGASGGSKVLILAYGATRLLPRAGMAHGTSARHAKVDNLFNPFVPVGDAEKWLLSLPNEQFDDVARALKELFIMLEGPEQLVRQGDAINVSTRHGYVPISLLSDGYQSVIGVTADIMKIMYSVWGPMEVAEGIVIIDELGAHLHPRWRMRVVSGLRKAFPRIQFIASTHDPLCLRGLYDGEIHVLEHDARGNTSSRSDLPPTDTMRVEQILLSEYFGLYSTVDPELDAKFLRYISLLGLDRADTEEAAELERVKGELESKMVLGNDLRERMMLETIDRYLARSKKRLTPQERTKAKVRVEEALLKIWQKIPPKAGSRRKDTDRN